MASAERRVRTAQTRVRRGMRELLAVSLAALAVLAPAASGAESERHGVFLFLGGATSTGGEGSSGFALGGEYEYRFLKMLGIGGLVEMATNDVRDVVVLAPLSVHPFGGLALTAAPGVQVRNGDTDFALRLRASYELPAGPFVVAPAFSADLVDGQQVYVYGLKFGVRF